MKAPAWFPAGLRNDHAGPLNARVHRQLIGIYALDGAAEALVELLRSEEDIDRHTRAALADALEADLRGHKSAIRFRLTKPAHRGRAKVDIFEKMLEMQEIAKLYRLYSEQNLTWDEAAYLLEQLGCRKTKLAEALDYDEHKTVTVSETPRKSPTLSE